MTRLEEQAAADQVRVAAVQFAPALLDPAANLNSILDTLTAQSREDVALAVFPECALTGYVIQSRKEALGVAETVPGPITRRIVQACQDLQIFTVAGLLERDGDGLYNTAVLIGPDSFVAKYRKAHLPKVGVDRHVDPGNIPFEAHPTVIGTIGMLICYDHRFPEAIRCLALDGMEIFAHPTNWPTGMSGVPGHRPEPDAFDYRARVDRVAIISADRCGTERGVEFIGGSTISIQTGEFVARAKPGTAEVIQAVISPKKTREKGNRAPHLDLESNLFEDRRPELYTRLTSRA
jgi:predicted amidohydrolase